jgi:sRNA-binding carbon storage regulator CsrA
VVTVLEVRGRYVRLGVEAPAKVRILRGELQGSPRVEPPAEPLPAPHVTAEQ